MTLVELMISVAIMLVVIAGAMLVILAAARSGRGTQDLSDTQRGGRTALSLMATEIGSTGLGLPRALAVRSYDASIPKLTVASLDYRWEWTASSTTGTTASGSIALSSGTPVGGTDVALAAGEWVLLYQNAKLDDTGGANHGYGILQLGAARVLTATTLTIGSTNYSTAQTAFNLNQVLPTSPHAIVVLRVHTAAFGLDRTDTNHPYLYFEENGQAAVPVARNVESLTFTFYVDANCDGLSDDQNGDHVINLSDAVGAPTATRVSPCDPAGTTEVQVTAIGVQLRVRAEEMDPTLQAYRHDDFSEIIPTRNVSTRSKAYQFVDNNGI